LSLIINNNPPKKKKKKNIHLKPYEKWRKIDNLENLNWNMNLKIKNCK
jgi:hypothetical protein